VLDVHAALVAAGVADADDPAGTWAALVELHHAGVLDVSQAPNRRWLTAVLVNTTQVPAAFDTAIAGRRTRATAELAALRGWYASTVCANQGFADYFASSPPGTVPAGTCSTPACRCSSCWAAGGSGSPPALLEAIVHPRSSPASAAQDRLREARLDEAVEKLLWDNRFGLGVRMILLCLRGMDTYYDTRERRRRPLRSKLLYHRLFGSRPGLREMAIAASLDRLATTGVAVAVDRRWRHAAHVAADDARATRAAAAGGGTP
jgi:hypothetical protein